MFMQNMAVRTSREKISIDNQETWLYNREKMTQLKTNLLELHELENIDLKTITVDGKRYYTAEGAEDSIRYLSVTTVTGLHSKEQIKLWRKRVGEEGKQNHQTNNNKGTSFQTY